MGAPLRQQKRSVSERPQVITQPLSFGLAQAGAMLGISREQVRLEIQRGKLAAKRLGRRIIITEAALRQYLAALEDA